VPDTMASAKLKDTSQALTSRTPSL
jgi:hypothetical protein